MIALRPIAAFVLLLAAGLCRAQQPAAEPATPPTPARPAAAPAAAPALTDQHQSISADGLMTLHVYTNLEQVATLILTSGFEPVKKFDPERIRVSLDSGPLFKPTHVRLEGDDPLSIAVLIDARHSNQDLLDSAEDAVTALAGALHDRDAVSVYAIDCALIRTGLRIPADAARLRRAASLALQPMHERQKRSHHEPACKPSVPLWDSMALVNHELVRQGGRRVIIVISPGDDGGSHNNWAEVKRFAQESSTAVFAILPPPSPVWSSAGINSTRRPSVPPGAPLSPTPEDPLDSICQLSGGMELNATRRNLRTRLPELVGLLRNRYIVEYPRSNDATAGTHILLVTVPKTNLYIRPTGITVPLADPRVLADPNTLPNDPDKAPQMGPRKPLRPSG